MIISDRAPDGATLEHEAGDFIRITLAENPPLVASAKIVERTTSQDGKATSYLVQLNGRHFLLPAWRVR